jgi:acetyl esterase/lipase
MRYEKIKMQVEGSQENTYFALYALDDSPEFMNKEKRPLMLVIPGGGYRMTSDREAEPIAMTYLSKGFHAAVLRYSVAPSHYPTQLREIAGTILWLRQHADEYGIDADKITVIGFSAGGHLAASLAEYWDSEVITGYFGQDAQLFRPDGLILGYPVITSGTFAHQDSFAALLADDYGNEGLMDTVSLEKHVSDRVPPVFLWHTASDDCVPVENSLLFSRALSENRIPFEMHIFPAGCHGLSLANDITISADGSMAEPYCAIWPELSFRWLDNLYKING